LGLPTQTFYGPQLEMFAGTLDQLGCARAVIETPFGHSSKSVQAFLARSLRLIAARLLQQGVLH
jgi:hypothetical protein